MKIKSIVQALLLFFGMTLHAAAGITTPTFNKTFNPDSMNPGEVSTLQFVVNNPQPTPATGMDFTDNLPAGLTIANPANVSTTCTGGTITAVSGSGTISYTGGSVAGSSSCTLSVDITGTSVGTYVNVTGDLTSNYGNSGAASDTLEIEINPPTFNKSFNPNTIGPGSISTIRFDIVNVESTGVRELAFTDHLPAGMTMATPSNATSECGGWIDAPDGGTTITFTNGSLPGLNSCSITVDVTSNTPGVHNNVTGDLTSDAGNSGSASADLTVDAGIPGFIKGFSPATVPFGSRSTLTFTIDNSLNPNFEYNPSFTDHLPSGMIVADPPNVITDCDNSSITAVQGSEVITFAPSGTTTLASGASCTASVDVMGNAVGTLNNTTDSMTYLDSTTFSNTQSGKAGAVLTVTNDLISLVKSFTNDPVEPGGTVNLQFTISNFQRSSAATNILFTDNLDVALSGLTAVGLPVSDLCGAGSTLSGTDLLTLTGGFLEAGQSCTFDVTLQVPVSAPVGQYTNRTNTVSADIDGRFVTGNIATDDLFVSYLPQLTMNYLDDEIGSGGSTVLEFTITNTSPDFAATEITFEDIVDSSFTVSSLPASGFCGAGSTALLTGIPNDPRIVINNAQLVPGDSCTFSVGLNVTKGISSRKIENSTGNISAKIDGQAVMGKPASDEIFIYGAPRIQKEFVGGPLNPGESGTLRFTITHDTGEYIIDPATNIAFSDDLDAALSGLTRVGLPLFDVCGSGSQMTGTTNLTFTGGTLNDDESCTFDVTVQVPAAALPGIYTNTTTDLIAMINGLFAIGNAATSDLKVGGLEFTKSFTDDPVLAGDTVTLEFTISNSSPWDATDIIFTDNLNQVINNLTVTGLPLNDVCGAGSILYATSGNRTIQFASGKLFAGNTCTFSVTIDVPVGTKSDIYGNTTSNLFAILNGSNVIIEPAHDRLTVTSDVILLTKEFTNDPVMPGDNVTLRFTLTNLDQTRTGTDIAFTDDLTAALAGLESISGTLSDVCGAGSEISGTDVLTFTGGSLPADTSCSFDVQLSVPQPVPVGTTVNNTTSSVTAMVSGLAVSSDPASDELIIDFSTFTKAFGGSVTQGGIVNLSFTIENVSDVAVDRLSFVDDLANMLPGAEALGLPLFDVCGTGSQIAGTSLLRLTNGNLLDGESCTFGVDVKVPVFTPTGGYNNTTSELSSNGNRLSGPATAMLQVSSHVPNNDRDGDGVINFFDACPNTIAGALVDEQGCSCDQLDDDNDHVDNCDDECPNNPAKTEPGVCGCDHNDEDSDADGVANCNDECPDTVAGLEVDLAGCECTQFDDDNDGINNCDDLCPSDPEKSEPGVCGCGASDEDSDNDTVLDCNDQCLDTEANVIVDALGCPIEIPPGQPVPSICGACGTVGMISYSLLVFGLLSFRFISKRKRFSR